MLRSGNVSSLVLVGRWGEAIETADELARSPHGHQVASMLGCALEIDCRRGDVERAKERLSSITDETEDPQVRASHALYTAIVLRAEGDPAAALEELQPALDARDSLGIRFLTVKLAIIEELECASALGDAARIDRVLEAIDELRPGERPPLLTAHAARFRARRTTDASEAEREFRGAAEIFRDHHLVFWLAVTQLEHAEWLVAQGREEDAEPLLAEARETFERLEATPWVQRAAARSELPSANGRSRTPCPSLSSSNSSPTSGSFPMSSRISGGTMPENEISPKRSLGSCEIQTSPSGSSGSCARNSSSVDFESARLQRSRRTVTVRSSSRPRAASRAAP